MNNTLTYAELLARLPADAPSLGCTYRHIEKALGIAGQTLRNEKSKSERGESLLKPKFYIGRDPYFMPSTIYDFYIEYTKRNQRIAA